MNAWKVSPNDSHETLCSCCERTKGNYVGVSLRSCSLYREMKLISKGKHLQVLYMSDPLLFAVPAVNRNKKWSFTCLVLGETEISLSIMYFKLCSSGRFTCRDGSKDLRRPMANKGCFRYHDLKLPCVDF